MMIKNLKRENQIGFLFLNLTNQAKNYSTLFSHYPKYTPLSPVQIVGYHMLYYGVVQYRNDGEDF